MKKNRFYVLLMTIVSAVAITSCSESDDTPEEFPQWEKRNAEYFVNVYTQARTSTDGSWRVIKAWSMEDTIAGLPTNYIVVKVLNKGTGSGCPMFTDSVRVSYRGRLTPSTTYPEGYVFDESYSGEYSPQTATPVTMAVSAVVDGFSTALQNMHIGDHWRVYIPQQLGYGTSDQSSIPAYSTLIFDIALSAYYRPGTDIPDWKAGKGVWIDE